MARPQTRDTKTVVPPNKEGRFRTLNARNIEVAQEAIASLFDAEQDVIKFGGIHPVMFYELPRHLRDLRRPYERLISDLVE